MEYIYLIPVIGFSFVVIFVLVLFFKNVKFKKRVLKRQGYDPTYKLKGIGVPPKPLNKVQGFSVPKRSNFRT